MAGKWCPQLPGTLAPVCSLTARQELPPPGFLKPQCELHTPDGFKIRLVTLAKTAIFDPAPETGGHS